MGAGRVGFENELPVVVVDEEDVRTVLSSCLPTEHICELHSLITFNRGVIEEAGLIPFVDGRDADKTSAEVYAVEDLVVSETIFFPIRTTNGSAVDAHRSASHMLPVLIVIDHRFYDHIVCT